MVIDARSGEVLHSRNADTRLHPASLTKMMTLYVVFEAVRRGELSLDQRIKISKRAAAEPPSKLGLKAGSRIQLRYLIRAAAVKSANDAATALGEAVSGSEAAFARRMNRTAKAIGMGRTTFKNAHGLTETGHMSTARDMTTLGRRLFYDYNDYYHLFSRSSIDAGLKVVPNTNRRLLANYRGADGIKTGYTRAAGFNLVASAERGNKRIIATVFGGRSTATRNAKVAELLDLGFRRAPGKAPVRKPKPPQYIAEVAPNIGSDGKPKAGKTIRLLTAVKRSLRPKARTVVTTPTDDAPQSDVIIAMNEIVKQAIAEASTVQAVVPTPEPQVSGSASGLSLVENTERKTVKPKARPAKLLQASVKPVAPQPAVQKVVRRVAGTGKKHWGINVGRYGSRYAAERVLLKTALTEMNTLDGSLRKVSKTSRGYDALFTGMTRETAELACRRLAARNHACTQVGPS
ncbi:D-alanyl-D-alanine carboxypeptidase family protein [Algirhabdus cladophorae]|uniref:D-alanyl-D-alanine carboxypeptidase family protein n=1 Tax=Algirhabdus cladophorae TaxID=3377108 RepID=UPI003B84B419